MHTTLLPHSALHVTERVFAHRASNKSAEHTPGADARHAGLLTYFARKSKAIGSNKSMQHYKANAQLTAHMFTPTRHAGKQCRTSQTATVSKQADAPAAVWAQPSRMRVFTSCTHLSRRARSHQWLSNRPPLLSGALSIADTSRSHKCKKQARTGPEHSLVQAVRPPELLAARTAPHTQCCCSFNNQAMS